MDIVNQYTPTYRTDTTKRTLKAFLDYLPSDGQQNLANHLRNVRTDQEIHDYAESLVNGLLLPFRTAYSTSTLLPWDGMEDLSNNTTSQSDEPVSKLSRLKEQCLQRDDHKCPFTQIWDESQVPKHDTLTPFRWTGCIDIIPFSLGTWKDKKERHAKAIVWRNLVTCFPELEKKLGITRHSLIDAQNAMTMAQSLHLSFGHLDFALEQTSTPHHYRIKNYRPNCLDTYVLPKTVTFESHDSRFALPSPELLNIHAIITKIFHTCGRAGYIERCVYKREKSPGIARDGSTDLFSILTATSLGVLATESSDQAEARAQTGETPDEE